MNIYEIQRKLAVLGYYPPDRIDGGYGLKTQTAIDEFKRKYKILDADVDDKLSEVINSMKPDSSDTFTDKLIKIAQALGASLKQTAYILATFKHETNGTFKPVEEAFWLSESARLSYLSKKKYGVKFAGRGFVQLTWERNYTLYEELLNLPLTSNPDIALDVDVSLLISIHGMVIGAFTTKKLSDYINQYETNYVNARYVVNGKDDAELIAGYAETYEKALIKGGKFNG